MKQQKRNAKFKLVYSVVCLFIFISVPNALTEWYVASRGIGFWVLTFSQNQLLFIFWFCFIHRMNIQSNRITMDFATVCELQPQNPCHCHFIHVHLQFAKGAHSLRIINIILRCAFGEHFARCLSAKLTKKKNTKNKMRDGKIKSLEIFRAQFK